MLCNLFWISLDSPEKLLTVGLKLLWLVNIIYSTAWMNQFEIKDACIKFVIYVSAQGNNNVKIKRKLKIEKIC